MAGTSNHRYFVELSDYSVAILRTSGSQNASVIEEYRDANLDDEAAVKEVMALARPADAKGPVPVICAVRPGEGHVHVATADEAGKHATSSAISSLLAQSASIESAGEASCVFADTGRAVDGSAKKPWVGVIANSSKQTGLLAKLNNWGLKPQRVESATLSLCGALQGVLAAGNSKDAVVAWEVGKTTSNLLLISANGVEASRKVAFGFERIAEAVLAEIQLKFKGAAAKLFFNTRYDFSSSGSKIAQRIADALAAEVSQLTSKRSPAPKTFVMGGFPSKQDWFASALAPCLGLELFNLNIEAWLTKSGLKVNDKAGLSKLSPAWLGVLGQAAAHSGENAKGSPAWHPEWKNAAPAADKHAKAEQPKSASAEKARPKSTPVTPARLVTAAGQWQKEHPQSGAGNGGNALATGVRIADPDTMGLSERSFEATKYKKGQMVRNLAFAAVVLALLGVGYVYFQNVEKQKQAALEAKQQAEQQAAALERARFEAEQNARAEAAARQRAEEEAAAKAAAAEAARVQAEEAARQREAERERLLHARGSAAITTIPAGAKVTIANLEPQLSPATFSDLRLGQYTAKLEREGYDATTVDFTVEENETTAPSPIRMVRHTGRLGITTQPAGVHYEVKPAAEGTFTSAMQSRIGITPHTLGSLPTGEYVVTLERKGWATVTRKVRIEHNQTATLSENLAGGTVRIVSNPPGASVFRGDTLLGITPLDVEDVAPGEISYRIEHPEYHPATLTGSVAIGATTDLSTTLEPLEVIARISELDRKPSPSRRVEPALDDPRRFIGHSALISLVVNEEGIPEDVEIVETSSAEFGQLCLEAVRQWEFRPGRIGREPVRTKVKIPFTIQ